MDEDHQHHHQGNGEDGGDDGNALDAQAPHVHHLGEERDVRVSPGDTAGDVVGQVLQQVADTDGRDHHGQTRCRAKRRIGDLFNHDAEQRTGDDRQNNGKNRMQVERGHGVERGIRADHDDVAVGKVNQTKNAVDHGVANGDEGVQTAHRDAGEQQLDIESCVMHKYGNLLQYESCAFSIRGMDVPRLPKTQESSM